MLLVKKSDRSEQKPPLRKDPLVELTLEQVQILSQHCPPKEIPELLLNGKMKNDLGDGDLLPEETQSDLANRFQKSTHSGAVIRLLCPLGIPAAVAAILRPLNEMMKFGLESPHFAGIFGFLLFASCYLGSRWADTHERKMGNKAKEILQSGRVTTESAQTSLCYIIRSAKDPETAFKLLIERRITFNSAELELAQTIFDHGSEAQAKTMIEGTYVSGFSAHLLSIKCKDCDHLKF
jgi:hypothetical protein